MRWILVAAVTLVMGLVSQLRGDAITRTRLAGGEAAPDDREIHEQDPPVERPSLQKADPARGDPEMPSPNEDEEIEEPVLEMIDIPDDPIQIGPCTLELRTVDAETGGPVAIQVQLWRLDAPENADYARGDQCQATVDVPKTGALVEQLPAGRYRVFCPGQRVGTEDAPAFQVNGVLTRVDVPIPTRKTRAVYLKVVNAQGRLLRSGTVGTNGGSEWTSTANTFPPWRRERVLRKARVWFGPDSGGASGYSGFHGRPARADDRGFLLGKFRDDDRVKEHTRRAIFTKPGHTDVFAEIRGRPARERTYVAVAVPEEEIAALVRLPGGDLAAKAGAKITAKCEALLDEGEPEPWRRARIQVEAKLLGYRKLTFLYDPWKPGGPRVMTPYPKTLAEVIDIIAAEGRRSQ